MRNGASACMVTRNTRPSKTKSLTYTGASMSCTAAYTSEIASPMDCACSRSSERFSCGAGGNSFGCTPVTTGLLPAAPNSAPIAPYSAGRPAALRSSSQNSKPPKLPRPGMVGKLKNSAMPSFWLMPMPKAHWLNSVAVALRSRIVLELDEEHADALAGADEAEAGDFEHRVHRFVGAKLFADARHELARARLAGAGRHHAPCRW